MVVLYFATHEEFGFYLGILCHQGIWLGLLLHILVQDFVSKEPFINSFQLG